MIGRQKEIKVERRVVQGKESRTMTREEHNNKNKKKEGGGATAQQLTGVSFEE